MVISLVFVFEGVDVRFKEGKERSTFADYYVIFADVIHSDQSKRSYQWKTRSQKHKYTKGKNATKQRRCVYCTK